MNMNILRNVQTRTCPKNQTQKILGHFLDTHRQTLPKRPDLKLIIKKKIISHHVDFAMLLDSRRKMRESKKRNKFNPRSSHTRDSKNGT